MKLALLLLALGAAACHQAPKEAPEPRPVLSVVVGAGEVNGRSFVGTVEGRYKTELAFRVGGRVVRRAVSVGDAVKRGQEIASLDRRALQLAVNAASADVAALSSRRMNAETVLGRQSALLERQTVAQSTFDEARTSRAAAVATVDEAVARLRKAREELDYGVLRADSDGIITRIDFEVEQVVAPNSTIAEIVRPDALDFVFDAPDASARQLRNGDVFVVHEERGGKPITGEIRQIAAASDRVTRTRRVWIGFPLATGGMRLGSTMYAERAAAAISSPRVPITAVLEDAGVASVWVVDKDVLQPRSVTLGTRTAEDVEVLTGLNTGDRVVIAGVHSVTAGQRIKSTGENAP